MGYPFQGGLGLGDAGFGGGGQGASWVPTRGQIFGVKEIKGLAVGVYRSLGMLMAAPHLHPLPTEREGRRWALALRNTGRRRLARTEPCLSREFLLYLLWL
jgi:hypothetical protein